jgi:autoinducer 2-degrading protein
MHIIHVYAHVKPEFIEAFKKATLDNARNSVQEPGIARFDVIQQVDDPTRFVLVEVYCSSEDTVLHKQTNHYARWRDTVEGMFVLPRSRIIYTNLFPDEKGW